MTSPNDTDSRSALLSLAYPETVAEVQRVKELCLQAKVKFGKVLSEEELDAFEHFHGCTLPVDYRCFLALAGNGAKREAKFKFPNVRFSDEGKVVERTLLLPLPSSQSKRFSHTDDYRSDSDLLEALYIDFSWRRLLDLSVPCSLEETDYGCMWVDENFVEETKSTYNKTSARNSIRRAVIDAEVTLSKGCIRIHNSNGNNYYLVITGKQPGLVLCQSVFDFQEHGWHISVDGETDFLSWFARFVSQPGN